MLKLLLKQGNSIKEISDRDLPNIDIDKRMGTISIKSRMITCNLFEVYDKKGRKKITQTAPDVLSKSGHYVKISTFQQRWKLFELEGRRILNA